jgi:hypothetical protein
LSEEIPEGGFKKMSLLRKLIAFPVVLFFIFAFNSHAGAEAQRELKEEALEDSISIQVNGVGTVKDDVASARKIAINDGLRVAVEQARGIMVKGETDVRDFAEIRDEVISKTKGFVRTYKILNETKEDNIYRVTLAVEVMLSDPEAEPPVKMDEKKYRAKIPKLLDEVKTIFRKTNYIAESFRNKKQGDFTAEDVKKLHQRYIVMLMIMKSIDPPADKREKMKLLFEAIRLKSTATGIFLEFMEGDRRPGIIKKGFELNRKGNRLLKKLRA